MGYGKYVTDLKKAAIGPCVNNLSKLLYIKPINTKANFDKRQNYTVMNMHMKKFHKKQLDNDQLKEGFLVQIVGASKNKEKFR